MQERIKAFRDIAAMLRTRAQGYTGPDGTGLALAALDIEKHADGMAADAAAEQPVGLSEAYLSEVAARCQAATLGPWAADGDRVCTPSDEDVTMTMWREEDAAFIAHARDDVPALLSEVDRLRQIVAVKVDAIEGALGRFRAAVGVVGPMPIPAEQPTGDQREARARELYERVQRVKGGEPLGWDAIGDARRAHYRTLIDVIGEIERERHPLRVLTLAPDGSQSVAPHVTHEATIEEAIGMIHGYPAWYEITQDQRDRTWAAFRWLVDKLAPSAQPLTEAEARACDCGHGRADHHGGTEDCVSCSCTKFTLEHPDKGKRCRLCGRGVYNCPDPCTCDGASIVALAGVVAAYEAWPGGGDGDPASEAMHAVHRALFEHDIADDDVLTANGRALLAANRGAIPPEVRPRGADMGASEGPVCWCGRTSTRESGWCGVCGTGTVMLNGGDRRWDGPRRYRSDDRDLPGHDLDLMIRPPDGNGDWYVSVLPHGDRSARAVRITTSGTPHGQHGACVAVAKLYEAMGGDHSPRAEPPRDHGIMCPCPACKAQTAAMAEHPRDHVEDEATALAYGTWEGDDPRVDVMTQPEHVYGVEAEPWTPKPGDRVRTVDGKAGKVIGVATVGPPTGAVPRFNVRHDDGTEAPYYADELRPEGAQ